jgi:hypothetical protein
LELIAKGLDVLGHAPVMKVDIKSPGLDFGKPDTRMWLTGRRSLRGSSVTFYIIRNCRIATGKNDAMLLTLCKKL